MKTTMILNGHLPTAEAATLVAEGIGSTLTKSGRSLLPILVLVHNGTARYYDKSGGYTVKACVLVDVKYKVKTECKN